MNTQTHSVLAQLLTFLDRLETARIEYQLDRVRDAIMVKTTIPGERWEIEFFDDGRVEIERFVSSGEIEGMASLETLISLMGD